MGFLDPENFDVRCEWGEQGIQTLSKHSEIVVIVDVLSFTTSVDLAVSQGVEIFPYDWTKENIKDFAAKNNLEIADENNPQNISLKPTSLKNLTPGLQLVMPSPNGSTLSVLSRAKTTVAGCLQNSRAVAQFIQRQGYKTISFIPAGERWKDGSLRPCFEDLLGAGAILSRLRGSFSPEAKTAKIVFEKLEGNIFPLLKDCVSGQEKRSQNLVEDIKLAAELDISDSVPLLVDGRYVTLK